MTPFDLRWECAAYLEPDTHLNDVQVPGFYDGDDLVGTPDDSRRWYVMVQAPSFRARPAGVYQEVVRQDNGARYYRINNGTTWTAWTLVGSGGGGGAAAPLYVARLDNFTLSENEIFLTTQWDQVVENDFGAYVGDYLMLTTPGVYTVSLSGIFPNGVEILFRVEDFVTGSILAYDGSPPALNEFGLCALVYSDGTNGLRVTLSGSTSPDPIENIYLNYIIKG